MEVPRQREWVIAQVYYSHYISTKEKEDIVLLQSHSSKSDSEYLHAHILHTAEICVCVCEGGGCWVGFDVRASNKPVDVLHKNICTLMYN